MAPRCRSTQVPTLGAKNQGAPEAGPPWSSASPHGFPVVAGKTAFKANDASFPTQASRGSQPSRRVSWQVENNLKEFDPDLDKVRAVLKTELCLLADQLALDVSRATDRACAELRRACDSMSAASDSRMNAIQQDLLSSFQRLPVEALRLSVEGAVVEAKTSETPRSKSSLKSRLPFFRRSHSSSGMEKETTTQPFADSPVLQERCYSVGEDIATFGGPCVDSVESLASSAEMSPLWLNQCAESAVTLKDQLKDLGVQLRVLAECGEDAAGEFDEARNKMQDFANEMVGVNNRLAGLETAQRDMLAVFGDYSGLITKPKIEAKHFCSCDDLPVATEQMSVFVSRPREETFVSKADTGAAPDESNVD